MEPAELVVAPRDRVRVKRKTLEAVLQQCHLALQHLASGSDDDEDDILEVPLDSADTSSPLTSCDSDTTEVKVLVNMLEGSLLAFVMI